MEAELACGQMVVHMAAPEVDHHSTTRPVVEEVAEASLETELLELLEVEVRSSGTTHRLGLEVVVVPVRDIPDVRVLIPAGTVKEPVLAVELVERQIIIAVMVPVLAVPELHGMVLLIHKADTAIMLTTELLAQVVAAVELHMITMLTPVEVTVEVAELSFAILVHKTEVEELSAALEVIPTIHSQAQEHLQHKQCHILQK